MHKDRRRRGWGRLIVAAVAVLVLLCLAWSLVEARVVVVDKAVLASPDLPPELDGTRIAFATDIHAGALLGRRQLDSTMSTIQGLNADVIILGGDFGGGGPGGYDWFYERAARLRAPLGVYAVLGNHEGGASRAARDGLQGAGIVLLSNDNVRAGGRGAGIRLAGVEDYLTGSPDVQAAARDIARDEFAVLVSHNPDLMPEGLRSTEGAFDLGLAGHTHGGQITAFGLWAPYVPSRYGQRFRGGWERVEGVPVLVSRGAGVFVLPMRFFAPAQVHVITLRRGPAALAP